MRRVSELKIICAEQLGTVWLARARRPHAVRLKRDFQGRTEMGSKTNGCSCTNVSTRLKLNADAAKQVARVERIEW